MAGAFGYEASHYDVSMKMAEIGLLPAVRAADDDTLLVANGTSCRHQIEDGADQNCPAHRLPITGRTRLMSPIKTARC